MAWLKRHKRVAGNSQVGWGVCSLLRESDESQPDFPENVLVYNFTSSFVGFLDPGLGTPGSGGSGWFDATVARGTRLPSQLSPPGVGYCGGGGVGHRTPGWGDQ